MSEEDNFEEDDTLGPEEEGEVESDSDSESDDVECNSSLTAKETERLRIQSEVEAFLARGGKINEIPPNVVADPPRKPESNYGGQPI